MDLTGGGGGGEGDNEDKKEKDQAGCSKDTQKPDTQLCDKRVSDLVEEEDESDEVEMKSASETVEGESDGGGDITSLRHHTFPDCGPPPVLTDTDTDTDDDPFSDAQEETNSSVIFKRRKLSNSRVYRRERGGSGNNNEEEGEAGHSGAGGGQMEALSADEDEYEGIPDLIEDTVDATSSHSGGLTSPDTEEEEETTDVDVASLARGICSKTPRPPRYNLLRDLYRVELGRQLRPSLRSRVCGSLETVQRLQMVNKLSGHEGCVNSVSFNGAGDRIASGSDDLHIILWDWQRNKSLLRFNTGHRANVFQSKILPGDLLVTSCSRDGQVRLAELSVTGALRGTKRLAQHKVRSPLSYILSWSRDSIY